ncbi:MAG: hypothetical protein HN416_12235 [Nitrospina sp.]|nr:hypothetical protein [Nitrospina sp.]
MPEIVEGVAAFRKWLERCYGIYVQNQVLIGWVESGEYGNLFPTDEAGEWVFTREAVEMYARLYKERKDKKVLE